MDVWGLTGMMGSGKSFVREKLAKMGFPCLDADQESARLIDSLSSVKELTQQETLDFLNELKAAFPNAVEVTPPKISREILRKEVSQDELKRKKLESIMIPRIGKLIRSQIHELEQKKHSICFVEGTRLAESTLRQDVLKGIIFVEADESLRFERIKKRNPYTYQALIELQKSQNENHMRKVSEVVWQNNNDVKKLDSQINAFLISKGYKK